MNRNRGGVRVINKKVEVIDYYELVGDRMKGQVATVSVSGGETLSTGKPYEFSRLDVTATLPTIPTDEGMLAAYNKCASYVDAFLDVERDKVMGDGDDNADDDAKSDDIDDDYLFQDEDLIP